MTSETQWGDVLDQFLSGIFAARAVVNRRPRPLAKSLIRDKVVTSIYFVIVPCPDDKVQCELCEEWLHMSREGFKTAREGEWLCIVCKLLDSRRLRNC